jgi:hypothetical protein
MTPILKNRTVLMNSGSATFWSSHVSTHTNLQSEFPRSDRSSTMHPLQIHGLDSLRNFGSFRPRPDQRSFDLLLDQLSISPSGLRRFHPLAFLQSAPVGP